MDILDWLKLHKLAVWDPKNVGCIIGLLLVPNCVNSWTLL